MGTLYENNESLREIENNLKNKKGEIKERNTKNKNIGT